MSRGLRWTPEALTARGWRDPDPPKYEGADTVAKLNAGFRLLSTKKGWDTPRSAQKPRSAKRQPKAGKPIPYERDVLRAVLAVLQAHPAVSWACRNNSGMAMLPGRGGKPQPVRFGFEGAADITGQMKGGLRLEVECKRPGKKPTMAQAAFLLRVREAGGVGFVASSVEDVWTHLGKP